MHSNQIWKYTCDQSIDYFKLLVLYKLIVFLSHHEKVPKMGIYTHCLAIGSFVIVCWVDSDKLMCTKAHVHFWTKRWTKGPQNCNQPGKSKEGGPRHSWETSQSVRSFLQDCSTNPSMDGFRHPLILDLTAPILRSLPPSSTTNVEYYVVVESSCSSWKTPSEDTRILEWKPTRIG